MNSGPIWLLTVDDDVSVEHPISDDWQPSWRCIGILTTQESISIREQKRLSLAFITYWKNTDEERTQKNWDKTFYKHCIRTLEIESHKNEVLQEHDNDDLDRLYKDF